MSATVELIPLSEMGVTRQRREIAYYFLKAGKLDESKLDSLRAALNDWLSPKQVLAMYRTADGTGLLELIHQALVAGLGAEIDKKNENQEDDDE